MDRSVLAAIAADLREGRVPVLSTEDFPCFSDEAVAGNRHVEPSYLGVLACSLTADDAPTFERALRAMDEGDLAWLGFKIVYDADEAQRNTDNEVTKKYGDEGRPTASRSCSSATTRRRSWLRGRTRRATCSR